MALEQMVESYLDELETHSPAPSISHFTLATMYTQFGQSKTHDAIATECRNREQLRKEQYKRPILKTRREIVLECIAEFAPDGVIRTEN